MKAQIDRFKIHYEVNRKVSEYELNADYLTGGLAERAAGKRWFLISLTFFYQVLGMFAPNIKRKYSNGLVSKVVKRSFDKAADKMLFENWVMELPNSMGRIYLDEKRIQNINVDGDLTDTQKDIIKRFRDRGNVIFRFKWDKKGTRYKHRSIYRFKVASSLRSKLRYEVNRRLEDPTLKPITGNIRNRV